MDIYFLMIYKKKKLKIKDLKAKIFLAMFFLLAFGDTFHVGFRITAYLQNDFSPLLGYGSLATAITITLFYGLFAILWKIRFKKEKTYLLYFMFLLLMLRLLIFLPANNHWEFAKPPRDWSIYRNLPLIIFGLILAPLMLKDAKKENDKTFEYFSYAISLSYICFIPVVFFASEFPLIGLLMIPKTIIYLLMLIIGYKEFFAK